MMWFTRAVLMMAIAANVLVVAQGILLWGIPNFLAILVLISVWWRFEKAWAGG